MENNMQYAEIPYVDKPVSRIIFGTAMQPFMSNGDGSALLDAMYEAGVTTFDTARNYQDAEKSFGRWIEDRGIRDQIVILTKCGHPGLFGQKRVNRKEMEKDLKQSLKCLRTDYIDIYLLHRDDPAVDVGEIVEVFNEMHEDKKIGAFGGSNWTHRRIEEANEYAYKKNLILFSVSSPNFGLADQVRDPWGGGCVTISGPANREAREWYRKNQMPVIAYSSLGRGLFSGKLRSDNIQGAGKLLDANAMKGYGCPENFERLRRCEELAADRHVTVPQIAMSWIFRQQMNMFAVVSTSKPGRMQENIAAFKIGLTEEECAYLDLR